MANKKLLQDLNGKIKEIASSSVFYDDAGKLTVNRFQFNTASLDMPSGILSTDTSSKLSSSAALSDGDIISWDNNNKKWVSRQDVYDITSNNAAGDIGGTYGAAIVKNVGNVTSGTLNVANGGTGLSSALVTALGTGSALLVGHGTSPMTFIKHLDQGDLSKKPVLAINQDGTGWSYITQSVPQANVQVDIYDTPGSFTWPKPINTKMIRVLAQGGGGGGGSGANRNQAVAALGGAGGAAGAFVDSGLFQIDDSFTNIPLTVGAGGAGGVYQVTGASNQAFPSLFYNFENVYDSFNNSRTLTLTAPASLSTENKKFGNYSLRTGGNGSNNYTARVSPGVALSGDFTIECWLYMSSSYPAGAAGYVIAGTRNNIANTANRYVFVINATTKNLQWYNDAAAGSFTITGNSIVPADQWVHVAVVRSSNNFKFYINGVQDTATGANSVVYNNNDISIGSSDLSFEPLNYFNGFIDNFVIFPYAKYTSTFTPQSTDSSLESYGLGTYAGSAGQSSSFGSSTSGPFIAANGGNGGTGGNLSSTATAGGASVSASSNIYDNIFYNNSKVIDSSLAGSSNSTSTGVNNSYLYFNNYTYYKSGGGASGGSVISNYTTNYDGGQASQLEVFLDFESNASSVNSIHTLSITSPASLSVTNPKYGTKSLSGTGGANQLVYLSNYINTIGTGDYTVEFWLYVNGFVDTSGNMAILYDFYNNGVSPRNYLHISTAGLLQFTGASLGRTLITGRWYHIAAVRQSSSIKVYVDGVYTGTSVSSAGNISSQTLWIGCTYGSNNRLNGYIDNFKVYPSAVYTSNFTVVDRNETYVSTKGTTTSLNAVSAISSSVTSSIGNFTYPKNIFIATGGGGGASSIISENVVPYTTTIGLYHFKTSDGALVNYSYTKLGTPTKTAGSSIITSPVGMKNNLFIGDVLSTAYTATAANYTMTLSGCNFGTSNFTTQMWIYPLSFVNGGQIFSFGGSKSSTQNFYTWNITIKTDGTIQFFPGTGSSSYTMPNNLVVNFNQWNHIAFKRTSANTGVVFLNGVSGGTLTFNITGLDNLVGIGTNVNGGPNGTSNFTGYISELRVDNIALTDSDIQNYYNSVMNNTSGSFFEYPLPLVNSYPGGLGGNGAWGSGGGGGGASTNNTGSLVGTQQGGNGGNGYVAVISYKDF